MLPHSSRIRRTVSQAASSQHFVKVRLVITRSISYLQIDLARECGGCILKALLMSERNILKSSDSRQAPDNTGRDPLAHTVQLLRATMLGAHEEQTWEKEDCRQHAVTDLTQVVCVDYDYVCSEHS